MNPRLYQPTTKDFSNNGIGVLSDAAFCKVTEERNGILELVLDYPINGIHFSEIKQRSIITAKPNPTADAQPFRVYRVTKPLNGMVTVFAQHISYDLSGIAVTPFSAGSAAAALQALKTNSVVENPFEFWTDKSTVAEMNVKTPASVRAMLGGVQGSVLDTYGGEYEWDGFTVKLHNERGQNRGVSIRYGKNLTDLEQEENCTNVYTAVMPFWADSEGNYTMLTEKIVEVEGNFDFVRVLTLDLSNEFDAQPTQTELRERAQNYIEQNNIGIPKISLRVSFVPLEQTEEYKNIALLERVNLCDTINVEFEKLGISATAKVVKTVYNVLLNRYESVELGDARSNIADTLVKQEQAIKDAPKKAISLAAQAAEKATQLITGNRGGYVVIHSSTGASEPDEILIMDTPSIETATKVWRWNNSGLGYSESGYPGPYTSAWTIDGAFNADFITAGTISANLIKTGLLQSLNKMSSFDMDSGKLKIKLNNEEVEMSLSADGISYDGLIPAGDLTLVKYLGGINAYHNADVGSGFYPTSKMSIYDVYDANSEKVLGKLWNNGGTRSQLDAGGVYLRKADDMDTEYGSLSFHNNAGSLWLCQNEGHPWLDAYVDQNGNSIFSLSETDGSGLGVHIAVAYDGGQFTVLSKGSIKGGMIADPQGCELRIGGGTSSYNMAWNKGEGSHLQADHHHFLGKSEGLIQYLGYSGNISAPKDEYSAFIVIARPITGDYITSIMIPSEQFNDLNWQVASNKGFCGIYYDGTIIRKNGGSSGSELCAVYGIR